MLAVLELCSKGRKATIAKEKANVDEEKIENVAFAVCFGFKSGHWEVRLRLGGQPIAKDKHACLWHAKAIKCLIRYGNASNCPVDANMKSQIWNCPVDANIKYQIVQLFEKIKKCLMFNWKCQCDMMQNWMRTRSKRRSIDVTCQL